jgi:hypothetical protein
VDGGLREELERIMQKSLADPAKKEFKGVVWQDQTTGEIRFQELPVVASDPYGCWVAATVPGNTATEKIVATYHAHPHYHGEPITCTDYQTGAIYPGTVDYQSWGGGSPADWDGALLLSGHKGYVVPTYVMDFNRIHKLNPVTTNKSLWASNAQHWPRCTTPIGG